MNVLVTGSSGLIGSEAVRALSALDHDVVGVDNNQRRALFGPRGDTAPVRDRLAATCPRFRHESIDIRDRAAIDRLFSEERFDLVIHCAAQPSHDYSASAPLEDFQINALGTMHLLEACRTRAPDAVFCHLSTNKVYGDAVNRIPLVELDTRYDFAEPEHARGIAESFPIDNCLHSPFGAAKTAADLMVQEYARYFGLRAGVFRCGCLTGPSHAGVELHGFLSHLVKTALREAPYTIYGYKGKQVRDQLHATDVITALLQYARDPRPGAVYNLGGGRPNSISILEAISLIADLTGKRPQVSYDDTHRTGDHICYYSDTTRFRTDFPDWSPELDLTTTIQDIVRAGWHRSLTCV